MLRLPKSNRILLMQGRIIRKRRVELKYSESLKAGSSYFIYAYRLYFILTILGNTRQFYDFEIFPGELIKKAIFQ